MSVCTVEGCNNPIRARGWCSNHYRMARFRGTPRVSQPKQPCRECGKPSHGLGLCETHYRRVQRTGARQGARVLTRAEPMPPPMTSGARYWKHVPMPDDGCWEWQGVVLSIGYGQWNNDYAHVIAYQQAYGPIPHGWHVDHTCHNVDASCEGGNTCRHRRCVRPQHLEAVPPGVNLKRSWDQRKAHRVLAAAKAGLKNGVPG